MKEIKGMNPCPHNGGVACTDKRNCDKCGWNPIVAEERTERIKQELEEREKA
jgi:hypothetical protein